MRLWVSAASTVAQPQGHTPPGLCSPLTSCRPCRPLQAPLPADTLMGSLLISLGLPFAASCGPTVSSIKQADGSPLLRTREAVVLVASWLLRALSPPAGAEPCLFPPLGVRTFCPGCFFPSLRSLVPGDRAVCRLPICRQCLGPSPRSFLWRLCWPSPAQRVGRTPGGFQVSLEAGCTPAHTGAAGRAGPGFKFYFQQHNDKATTQFVK